MVCISAVIIAVGGSSAGATGDWSGALRVAVALIAGLIVAFLALGACAEGVDTEDSSEG